MAERDRLMSFKKSGKTDDNRRRDRAFILQMERTVNRRNDVARRRGLEEERQQEREQTVQVVDHVRAKLIKWKKEREENKRKERVVSRLPFKIGTVKYDDVHLYRPVGESKKFKPPQIVTLASGRSPVARYPLDSSAKPKTPNVAQALNDFATALTPIHGENFEPEMNRTFGKNSVKIEPIIAKEDQVQESELNSRITIHDLEAMNFAKDRVESTVPGIAIETDFQETPTVTGKPLLEKSEILERAPESGLLSDIVPESNLEECTNAVTQGPTEVMEQHDSQYFKSLHTSTVVILEKFCEKWMVLKQQDIPTHIEDLVQVAVGYAKLLIKQKLQQFAKLILDHLNENTKPPVFIEDLDGFCSLVDIQVQDLRKKFAYLDALQRNNWIEPEPEPQLKALRRSLKRKSNAHALIQPSRKRMKPHTVSSLKRMSSAVMKVSLMAKNIAITSPRRDSLVPVTPLSKKRTQTKKTGRKNMEPASSFPEVGQYLELPETPAHDPAIVKAAQMTAGGGAKAPILIPPQSGKVKETPNPALRRSTRLLKKDN